MACFKPVSRFNPHTNLEEWLDGRNPYTNEALRLVDRSAQVSREDARRLKELGQVGEEQQGANERDLDGLSSLEFIAERALLDQEQEDSES